MFKHANEETIREETRHLCRQFCVISKRRNKTILVNFIISELESLYGSEVENLFHEEWLDEVAVFCNEYQMEE